MLTRFQFLDALVKVACAKNQFDADDVEVPEDECLRILLNEYVIPNYNHAVWQGFREFKLYTTQVNVTLDRNIIGIDRLMAHYMKLRNEKLFTKIAAKALFCTDTKLKLSQRDFEICYGLCKMTVFSESIVSEHKRYLYLERPEFLDLIGRVADRKYKRAPWLKLNAKIDFVLSELFESIGFSGVNLQKFEAEFSASDDEY